LPDFFSGIIEGLAPRTCLAIILLIEVRATRLADEVVAGELVPTLLFVVAGVAGSTAAVGDTSVYQAGVVSRARVAFAALGKEVGLILPS
jgi:hypothetical protein